VVASSFKEKVIRICREIHADPAHLMSTMAFETGESFKADTLNPRSRAVGLIQFLPHTAQDLGITPEELSALAPERQLDYVRDYFNPYIGRLANLGDVYSAVLWPPAVGKPDTYTLFESPSPAYRQNRGLDLDRDFKVTRGEAVHRVVQCYQKGLGPKYAG
jgi:hypothetical protein